MKKRIGKIALIFLCVIVLFLSVSAIIHRILLRQEAPLIVPNGTLFSVNGHAIHIYTEGENPNAPTLVFLSGSATVAPVYDFKSVYRKLSGAYHIAVVEKAGYGYSEIIELPRDVEDMVSETRQALADAGEVGPFILLPHSFSGIEALYWAETYPNEVAGIVGLDMAVPESYDAADFSTKSLAVRIGQATIWLGLHRTIPGLYPIQTDELTEQEIMQQKYLMYRNAVNIDYLIEGEYANENAKKINVENVSSVPMLLFVSDGKETGDFWIPCEERFAQKVGAEIILLDCGHYIHYYKADLLAEKITYFMETDISQ